MAERRYKELEEIVRNTRDIESIVKVLYEIYCRITDIEYFTYRASIENIGYVSFLDVIEVGTDTIEIVPEVSFDRAVKVYNISYDNPDVVFINTTKTPYGVPINSGESEAFFIREGKSLYATFANTVNKIVVAYISA